MITIDKRKVRQHFDRHAREYDDYAVVQRAMADRLLSLVSTHKPPESVKNIIEIGCGTGGLTGKLLETYPKAFITAIDLSPQMAALTQERYGNESGGRLKVHVEDGEILVESGSRMPDSTASADLIISSATFQWFNEPVKTVSRWLHHVAPGGVLAFTTFGPSTFYELHEAFAAAEAKLGLIPRRHGQHFIALTDWKRAAYGEMPFYGEEDVCVESFADVYQFLHRVKRIGAGNANAEVSESSGGGRRLFAEMEKVYRARFAAKEGVRATYHMIYGLFGPTTI